ncbi:MAG: cytochrome c [bacterium]|nr:cytochrome c [bacterium]
MQLRHVCGVAVLVAAASLAPYVSAQRDAPSDPAKIQKARTALMKNINQDMRKARVAIKKKAFQELAATSKELSALIARIPELSPKGSAFGTTRIKSEVWKKFDHFRKLSTESSAAAARLAKVAAEGDQKSATQAFRGLAKTCTNCHKPYREKKTEE